MNNHGKVSLTSVNYSNARPITTSPLMVQDLSLRDGHQSLFATRGRTEDMLPIAEMMDDIGFWAIETWGGATFDTMHRFLNEDPWERIRTLKKYIKKTPFSMLLRGQNLVGYRNYADDLARVFVERSAENGIDVFRTFDALNDYRNFDTVVPAIKACGKHFQGCVCYTLTEPRLGGEVYNLKYYLNKAKELVALDADSICIKDMAGLLAPYDAYQLVTALKENVSVPIHLHSHCTSGMAAITQLKAIEAGVDIIDTCLSPYAGRTSHPPVEPVVMMLLGTNRDTGFDVKKLVEINDILEKQVLPKYRHLLSDAKVSITDINVLLHQTPGGMLSNLVGQLRDMDELDKLDKVYSELPRVRKDLGQVPLVTPTSQIVGVQTVNNVLFDKPDEHYSKITDQVKDLCYGLYGKTTKPINVDVLKKALKNYPRGEEPITCRPAEILEPELEKAKEEIKDITDNIDDVLTYALYPTTGKKFLKWKYGKERPPAEVMPKTLEQAKKEEELVAQARKGEAFLRPKKDVPPKGPGLKTFNVFVDGEYFEVGVEPVRGKSAALSTKRSYIQDSGAKLNAPRKTQAGITSQILAPMPGMIIRYEKNVGDKVTSGENVVILEAMKMENAIQATADGTISSVNFTSGDSVKKDDVLCIIENEKH